MAVLEENCKPLPPAAIKVFEGEVFTIWQWQQKLYNGQVATYERISRADTAHTVGVLANGNILLVWDEQPDRGPVYTPAGGVIEPGESPAEGAKREFLEETGYKINRLKPWHTYRPSSKMEWRVHAFIGQDLVKAAEPIMDAGEKIALREFSFEDFLELGSNNKMRDLVMRIILLEARIDKRKQEELKQILYG